MTTNGRKNAEAFEVIGPSDETFQVFAVNDANDVFGIACVSNFVNGTGGVIRGGVVTQLNPHVSGACRAAPFGIDDPRSAIAPIFLASAPSVRRSASVTRISIGPSLGRSARFSAFKCSMCPANWR